MGMEVGTVGNRQHFPDPVFAKTRIEALRAIQDQHDFIRRRGRPDNAPTRAALASIPDDTPATARFVVLQPCDVPWQGQRILLKRGAEFALGRYGNASVLNGWIYGCGLEVASLDGALPEAQPAAQALDPDVFGDSDAAVHEAQPVAARKPRRRIVSSQPRPAGEEG